MIRQVGHINALVALALATGDSIVKWTRDRHRDQCHGEDVVVLKCTKELSLDWTAGKDSLIDPYV